MSSKNDIEFLVDTNDIIYKIGVKIAECFNSELRDIPYSHVNVRVKFKCKSILPCCSFTSIFSINYGKIKIDLISFSYQTYYEGDYAHGITEKTTRIDITEVYPIILKKSTDWNIDLSLFKATNRLFKTKIKNLGAYIFSYTVSNVF